MKKASLLSAFKFFSYTTIAVCSFKLYRSVLTTMHKKKSSLRNFYNKCEQIRRHLQKNSLKQNFIFCAVWDNNDNDNEMVMKCSYDNEIKLSLKETRNSSKKWPLNLSWISNKTMIEVGNITKAATFKSFLHLSHKNTQLIFLWQSFLILSWDKH